MSCCKCCPPIIPVFEFEISNDIFIQNLKDVNLPIIPETNIDLLKDKIICEYKSIISKLEQGNKPDLKFLLNEISVVELENELDKKEFIIQYYLNNN